MVSSDASEVFIFGLCIAVRATQCDEGSSVRGRDLQDDAPAAGLQWLGRLPSADPFLVALLMIYRATRAAKPADDLAVHCIVFDNGTQVALLPPICAKLDTALRNVSLPCNNNQAIFAHCCTLSTGMLATASSLDGLPLRCGGSWF